MGKKVDYIEQFNRLKEIEKLKFEYHKKEISKSVLKKMNLEKYAKEVFIINEIIKIIK